MFCVCVFWHVLYVFKIVFRICAFEFILDKITHWVKRKELLCSILHPSITIKGMMLPNSPVSAAMANMEHMELWMSTQWQLVGFYVRQAAKTCPNMAPTCPNSPALTWHRPGTYPANFNMGALRWNPWFLIYIYFLWNVRFRESKGSCAPLLMHPNQKPVPEGWLGDLGLTSFSSPGAFPFFPFRGMKNCWKPQTQYFKRLPYKDMHGFPSPYV